MRCRSDRHDSSVFEAKNYFPMSHEKPTSQQPGAPKKRRPFRWCWQKLRQMGCCRAMLLIVAFSAVVGCGISYWQRADTLPMTGVTEIDPVRNFRMFLKEQGLPPTVSQLADFDHQEPRHQWRSVRLEYRASKPDALDGLLATWIEQLRAEVSDHGHWTSGRETDRVGRSFVSIAFELKGTSLLTNCHIQVRVEKLDGQRYVISYYAHELPKYDRMSVRVQHYPTSAK